LEVGLLEAEKECPHCGFRESLKHFGQWERDGKRGLLGKTPEGYIVFLCPQCGLEIKYDSVLDRFEKNEGSGSNRHVPLIMGILQVSFSFFLVFSFSGWWKYIPASFILYTGIVSLKAALFASDKLIEEFTTPVQVSEESDDEFNGLL
jgi:hypothetical protein